MPLKIYAKSVVLLLLTGLFLTCIVLVYDKGIVISENRRFFVCTKGLEELLQWLLTGNCKDIYMESTDKYWIPIYNIGGKRMYTCPSLSQIC